MAKAIDVARYFLNRADREAGDAPTHLWVQKQIYYAQVWSLVFLGRELFEDKVEAWENGPAVHSVYTEFKSYGRDVIPDQPTTPEMAFSTDEIKVLDAVWERYGGLTASALWKLSHSESPWNSARVGLEPNEPSHNPISVCEMRSYYGDFGTMIDGNFFIEPRVLCLSKDKISISIELMDGTKRQVELKDLEKFLEDNADLIQYKQSKLPKEGAMLL